MKAIDRRSVAARAAHEWRNEVLVSLGGGENVSAQRLTILEVASRTKLFLDHADAFLLSQTSLVNKRSKSFVRLVEQRQRLADSLVKHLQALGLDRVPKPVPSLAEVLREHTISANDDEEPDQATAPANGEAQR